MYGDCLDDALLSYIEIKSGVNTGSRTGNFGNWCIFDKEVFCQEREGCRNCMIALRK